MNYQGLVALGKGAESAQGVMKVILRATTFTGICCQSIALLAPADVRANAFVLGEGGEKVMETANM